MTTPKMAITRKNSSVSFPQCHYYIVGGDNGVITMIELSIVHGFVSFINCISLVAIIL